MRNQTGWIGWRAVAEKAREKCVYLFYGYTQQLVEQAIGLVQKLTPLAAEAGKRVKDAVVFVISRL